MAAQARTVSDLGLTALQGKNPEITGLAVDSRDVKDGYLFAALPGTQVHGATFIQFALRMGGIRVALAGSFGTSTEVFSVMLLFVTVTECLIFVT